jgi:hypothetical protein
MNDKQLLYSYNLVANPAEPGDLKSLLAEDKLLLYN